MDEKQKMQILADLVKIRSVNDHELQVATYLKGLLDAAGIDNEILPLDGDRANLVATLGAGKPILGITGHMDVVDVEAENWKTDPFELTEDGDNLYGRGVADMKDGLAAMVIALITLKEQHVALNGTVRFFATTGEEVGEIGSKALAKAGYMDGVEALLVGEPTGYRIINANKGTMNLTVKATGKAAHSSMPKLGRNAAKDLINVLSRMQTQFDTEMAPVTNTAMGGTLYNVDVLRGGNQVNAIPGSASAEINMRTIPELPNDQIVAQFQQTIDQYNQETGANAELIKDTNIISTQGNDDAKLIKLIKTIGDPYVATQNLSEADKQREAGLLKLLDMPYDPDHILTMSASGGTDAAQLLKDQPVGFDYAVFGPGNDTQHQDNEYTSKRMYLNFIEIYQKLITAYLK